MSIWDQPFMGVAEVSEALTVSRATVSSWVRRETGPLPKPFVKLKMGPLWKTDDVAQVLEDLWGDNSR
jgi:hypothetical protein